MAMTKEERKAYKASNKVLGMLAKGNKERVNYASKKLKTLKIR